MRMNDVFNGNGMSNRKKEQMRKLIRNKKLALIMTGVGALGGFLYWRFIGCNTGTCPIRSVWYMSTLWGAVMGYLVGDMIADFVKKRRKNKEKQP